MNILIFSELLYPHGGGAELATWLYIKELSKLGFNITIITSKFKNEPSHEIINERIKLYRIPLKGSRKLMDSRYYIALNSGILFSSFVTKLIKWADVIYIPGNWYLAILLAKKYKKPSVLHLHNYGIISPSSIILACHNKKGSLIREFIFNEKVKGNTFRAIIATILNEIIGKYLNDIGTLADSIICVSKKQAYIVKKYRPNLARKIKVIYNPLPDVYYINRGKNLSEKPTFIYVGGDSYIKGFTVLLKALLILVENGIKNFKLILTNKYHQRSIRLIESLKKKYNLDVQILGHVNREELLKLHSQAWALLFPSIWEEPLPYAIMESMLLGTIPVASRVGGVQEIVENTIGERFLFAPGNELELVDRIERIISMDIGKIHDLQLELPYSIFSKFDKEKSVKDLVRVFDSLKY